MPSTEILLAFVAAAAVFAYTPGPSTLYAAAQTIARGRRGGLMAALGIHVGGYVHVFAASFGLAALFAALPTLYTVFKFVGAAYLIYLGIRMAFPGKRAETDGRAAPRERSTRRAFWESATVEILNPKTALFFVAFLPQFSDPAAALPIWGQLLILGTIVNLMFSTADFGCVFLAERVTRALQRSDGASRWANRVGGGILVTLGAHLLTSE